jgi:enoyl-CoA hydratase
VAPAVSVDVEHHDAVAVVRLTRSAKANALDGDATDALLQTLRTVAAEPDVAAVVLTGNGDSFSAGGDFDTIRAMRDDRQVRDQILAAHRDLFWTLVRFPVPTVAAVQGPAIGAGCTLALLCDCAVMADTAFLSDPRVSLGLLDGAGGFLIWPLLTSLAAAREHLLLGDRISGEEAYRLGLVNRVAPPTEVLPAAVDLARRFSELPRQSVQAARRLLNFHLERSAQMLDACSLAETACFDGPEFSERLEELARRHESRARQS